MDPLALTTGIVTLLRASFALRGTVAKVIDLRNAPALVQAVSNEISDLHLVLLHINDYFENVKSSRSTIPSVDGSVLDLCSSILDQTRNEVEEVEMLIKERLLKISNKKVVKISRKRLLLERNNLTQLRVDIRSARQRIVNLFGHFGIRDISRIEVLLNDIRSNDLSILLQCQKRIEQQLDHIASHQSILSDPDQQSVEVAEQRILHGQHLSSIQISLSRPSVSKSRPKCVCPRQSASKALSTFFGNVFLGYNAHPSLRHHQLNCPYHMNYMEFKAQLVYIFPSWFLRYGFSLQSKLGRHGTIICSLSIRQIIPIDHFIFDLVEYGDLNRMKELFGSRQISPNAENVSGTSLIEQSILVANLDSTKFLLEIGADINSSLQWPAKKLAWDRILANVRTPKWRQELESLFPDPDFEEVYNFSALHTAVLGLISQSIKSILCVEPTLLDQTDAGGRSALSWAAQKGDEEAIRTLLSYRANPDIADDLGKTPLMYAARECRRCVELLCQAGANVEVKTSFGMATALHYAAESSLSKNQNMEVIEAIVQAGADVNATDHHRETALFGTIFNENSMSAQYLIERGADPGIRNLSGNNLLGRATKEIATHSSIFFFKENKTIQKL
ncbi:MAG: hypothetical protein Q9160_006896 [Pyrenula sp. 1 TL-2023]